MIKKLWRVTEWLFPNICVLCAAASDNDIALCKACQAELPWLANACERCALPLPHDDIGLCNHCFKEPPPYDRAMALFAYQAPIDRLITSIKFQNKLVNASVLGALLARSAAHHYAQSLSQPDCIIPIPLHTKRCRKRGFNQALELARPLASALNIPLEYRVAHRTRATAAQSDIHAVERRSNMKNAFELNKDFTAKHVIVVDDVMTTGSTVNAFCDILNVHNVSRIDVWCCARTGIKTRDKSDPQQHHLHVCE